MNAQPLQHPVDIAFVNALLCGANHIVEVAHLVNAVLIHFMQCRFNGFVYDAPQITFLQICCLFHLEIILICLVVTDEYPNLIIE